MMHFTNILVSIIMKSSEHKTTDSYDLDACDYYFSTIIVDSTITSILMCFIIEQLNKFFKKHQSL